MQFQNTQAFAQMLDQQDELRSFRDQFIMPVIDGKQQIYFLGNSLGLQPKRTAGYLQQVLNKWANYGVEGFFMGEEPWLQYHDKLVQPLSTIVGALPHEVVAMNQLTVNLHLLLVSFYQPTQKRNKIICEARAFPSDQYMLETHVKYCGFDPNEVIIEVAPRAGEHNIRHEDILQAIQQHKDELALVMWGGLNYYTGKVFDMAAITKAAQAVGAKVGFDLAHAAGNIPLQLHNWNVDFAAWCSYKYMNSGPGGIGGAYIHERYHNDDSLHRFAGWWGYDTATRFLMQKGFKANRSAEGWQLSTPSALLYAAHQAALDIFMEAGIDRLQTKRRLLNNWLWFLLDELNGLQTEPVVDFITPRTEAERGSQVSMLMLQQGKQVFDALARAGVIVDWREPNVIRLAPVPLYNTFEEVWQFTNILRQILQLQHA
ncbi:kynureninase [Niastella populi]|uniref:Kynureninase n=1 Tax=Niastella populi TaxID=550983 RepID=A0A1V9FRA6_9BACT|nr:kynureninase [Niastella populi]OQP60858.1 kynureninase [Niastella populi]